MGGKGIGRFTSKYDYEQHAEDGPLSPMDSQCCSMLGDDEDVDESTRNAGAGDAEKILGAELSYNEDYLGVMRDVLVLVDMKIFPKEHIMVYRDAFKRVEDHTRRRRYDQAKRTRLAKRAKMMAENKSKE